MNYNEYPKSSPMPPEMHFLSCLLVSSGPHSPCLYGVFSTPESCVCSLSRDACGLAAQALHPAYRSYPGWKDNPVKGLRHQTTIEYWVLYPQGYDPRKPAISCQVHRDIYVPEYVPGVSTHRKKNSPIVMVSPFFIIFRGKSHFAEYLYPGCV